jgi:hypothetical protein
LVGRAMRLGPRTISRRSSTADQLVLENNWYVEHHDPAEANHFLVMC